MSQSRVKVATAAAAAAPVLDLLLLGTATHRGRWDAPGNLQSNVDCTLRDWITFVCFSAGKAEEGCLQEDVRAGVKTKKGLFRRKDRRDQTFSQGTEEIKYERENVDSH